MILATELYLGARPFAVKDRVADLHAQLLQATILEAPALADRDDLALHGLFLGRIGNDQSALGAGLGGHRLQQNSIVQRLESHGVSFVLRFGRL